jgi:hypothetical protein
MPSRFMLPEALRPGIDDSGFLKIIQATARRLVEGEGLDL